MCIGKEKLLTFEEKLERLKEIVAKLESPDMLELDASLALFEEGVGLVRSCKKLLEEAELRVQNLTKEENGDTEGESAIEDENGE